MSTSKMMQVTVTMEKSLADDIDLLARAVGKSRSNVVREALREHLASAEKNEEVSRWIKALRELDVSDMRVPSAAKITPALQTKKVEPKKSPSMLRQKEKVEEEVSVTPSASVSEKMTPSPVSNRFPEFLGRETLTDKVYGCVQRERVSFADIAAYVGCSISDVGAELEAARANGCPVRWEKSDDGYVCWEEES